MLGSCSARVHSKTLSQKSKGWGCSSEVEQLPSMHKALDWIPTLSMKKKVFS
jgi:hypothetical protein